MEEFDFIKRMDFSEVEVERDVRESLEKVDDAIRTLEFSLKLTEGYPPIFTGTAALLTGFLLKNGSLWWTAIALALPLTTPEWARRYSLRASTMFLSFVIAADIMALLNGNGEALYFLLTHTALLGLTAWAVVKERGWRILPLLPAAGAVPSLLSTFVPRYGAALLPFVLLYPSLLSWESRRAVREELLRTMEEILRSRRALREGNLERYDPSVPEVFERKFMGFGVLLLE